MSRALGIDYGTKRIGFAISDEANIIAMPLCSLEMRGVKHALQETARLAQERAVATVVVGIPLNMNGTRGPAAVAAESFVEQLRATLPIPVETWDERLSTCAAERVLIDADVSRNKRKQVVDKLAAQIILQAWLDFQSLRQATPPPAD